MRMLSHGGLAQDPTASVWRTWDLNLSLNLKVITLPIPSHWSSEAQHREEMQHGERGRAGEKEPEGLRRKAES